MGLLGIDWGTTCPHEDGSLWRLVVPRVQAWFSARRAVNLARLDAATESAATQISMSGYHPMNVKWASQLLVCRIWGDAAQVRTQRGQPLRQAWVRKNTSGKSLWKLISNSRMPLSYWVQVRRTKRARRTRMSAVKVFVISSRQRMRRGKWAILIYRNNRDAKKLCSEVNTRKDEHILHNHTSGTALIDFRDDRQQMATKVARGW